MSKEKTPEELETEKLLVWQEAENFKKQYSSVIKTVDSLLDNFSKGDKGLVDSLLEDFAPSDPKRKPGISAGSIFRLIGFAFRNPGKIGDLIKIGRNPEILQNKTFQQEIIKSDNTWNFVDTLGDRLPKVGKALANFGVNEFKEKAILDQEALKTLQPIITDQRSRFVLKKIANQFMDPFFDQNQNIDQIVNLMLSNKAFQKYMVDKKESLTKYIVDTSKYMMQPEVKYYQELQNKGISLDEQAVKIGKRLSSDTKEQMQSYGITLDNVKTLGQIIPMIVDKPEQLQKFYASYSKSDWQKLGSDVIDMGVKDPKILNFIKQNTEIFQNIMIASTKTNAKKYVEAYKITDEQLKTFAKLVPILLEQPKELQKLYKNGYGEPNYTQLTEDIINLAARDNDVKAFVVTHSDVLKEVMVNSVLGTPELAKKFKQYGIDENKLNKITEIVPILCENPSDLKKFYDNYKEGKFIDLGKDLLELSKNNNQEIDKYLQNNKEVFKDVLENVIKSTDDIANDIAKFGVKSELVDLLSPLLNSKNTTEVKAMMEQYEKSNYTGLILNLCNFIEKDPEFKEQLSKNTKTLGKIVQKSIENDKSLKGWLGTGQIKDFVSTMLSDPKSIKSAVESFQKGGFVGTFGVIKELVNSPEKRGGIIKAVSTRVFGDGKIKVQETQNDVLNKQELTQIVKLSNKIAKNLFGENHGRQDSAQLINESLQEAFKDLKKQNNNIDIHDIIENNKKQLVGELIKEEKPGMLYGKTITIKGGTGLKGLYYDKHSITTAGIATGGIYLEKRNVINKEFASQLTSYINNEIGKEIAKKSIVQNVDVKSHILQNPETDKKTKTSAQGKILASRGKDSVRQK